MLRPGEVERVVALLLTGDPSRLSAQVYAALGPAKDRFDDLDEDDQDAFRDALGRFVRVYSFLSQVVDFGDTDLERDYLYCKALATLIRKEAGTALDLGSEVELTHLKHEMTFEGSIDLPAGRGVVEPLSPEGGRHSEPEQETLSTIIQRLNDRFGLDLGERDMVHVEAMVEDMADQPDTQLRARANSFESFMVSFDNDFVSTAVNRIDRNEQLVGRLLDNPELRGAISDIYAVDIYRRARVAGQRTCPIGELLEPDREDEFLEFKSTLRWDIKQDSAKTGIPEKAVIKTIAGFLNARHGGTLLVGVADDGSLYGLEDDYASFSKRGERGRPRPMGSAPPESGRWAPRRGRGRARHVGVPPRRRERPLPRECRAFRVPRL